tara:strand:+ start:2015 stop:3115 length:1101 start_codon:yes stop_codon:yes gene_type:complete
MAIINVNSISGINSITAQGASGIEFFDSSGSSVQKVTGDGLTVGTGATISGSTNEVIVRTADASSTALRLRSDGGGTNSGHLEGEGPKITFDAKRGADGVNSPASYIQQVAIGDLGSSFPVDLAFGVRRFGSSFEALRIASTGNVGVGIDNPTSKLHIDGNVRSNEGYTVYPPSDSNYAFATRNAANNQWTAFIEANGKATFAGNVVLSTPGSGIDFSATSNSSGTMSGELFNDYEEGSWTPQITQGIVGTPSYSLQMGWYTKIGREVQVYFYLRLSGSGNTGDNNVFRVGNFPFPIASNHYSAYLRGMGASNYHSIPGFTSANVSLYGGGSSNTYASLYQGDVAVGTNVAVNLDFIIGGFKYISE